MKQIIQHLTDSKNVFLCSHINPDGDAIASLLAMGLSLASDQRKITLYNESPIPAAYRFLPSVKSIVQHINKETVYDTAIVFDCGDMQRIGKAASFVNDIPVVINIDHHISNTYFGNFQLIDSSACATVEIIYRILKKMKSPINRDIATSIYTGILTDTGSFRFANTSKFTFEICAEMVDIGADPYSISKNIYETHSLGYIKLLNKVLGSIEISKNGKLCLMTVTQEMLNKTKALPEETNGLINYATAIKDIKIAVLIKELHDSTEKSEKQDRFHVSLRSDGDFDVAAFASSFGGGGHYRAAGFNFKSSIADLKKHISNLAEKI